MKFFCEYCGNRIDALKDDKCPNCGAYYKKNKNKENELNNEYKHKIINHVLVKISNKSIFNNTSNFFLNYIYNNINNTYKKIKCA